MWLSTMLSGVLLWSSAAACLSQPTAVIPTAASQARPLSLIDLDDVAKNGTLSELAAAMASDDGRSRGHAEVVVRLHSLPHEERTDPDVVAIVRALTEVDEARWRFMTVRYANGPVTRGLSDYRDLTMEQLASQTPETLNTTLAALASARAAHLYIDDAWIESYLDRESGSHVAMWEVISKHDRAFPDSVEYDRREIWSAADQCLASVERVRFALAMHADRLEEYLQEIIGAPLLRRHAVVSMLIGKFDNVGWLEEAMRDEPGFDSDIGDELLTLFSDAEMGTVVSKSAAAWRVGQGCASEHARWFAVAIRDGVVRNPNLTAEARQQFVDNWPCD